jgi:hypothetical protein
MEHFTGVLVRSVPAAMRRALSVNYGVASYLAFLAAFLYVVGFVGNLPVPTTTNSQFVESWR